MPRTGAACPHGRRFAVWAAAVLLATVALPATAAELDRIAGTDRFATAVGFARDVQPGVGTVFVVTGTDYPDGLAVAPAAARLGAPVLLVTRDAVPPATGAELQRLRPGRVVVVGGPAVIGPGVERTLGQYAGSVTRVAGTDRYDTARLLSRTYFPSLPSDYRAVFLASGEAFPDALGLGAAGALAPQVPLLLTARDHLPGATRAEVARLAPDLVVLAGGPAAVAPQVIAQLEGLVPVLRLSGADRYETAAVIVDTIFRDVQAVVLANGEGFADALVAGTLGLPLLLTSTGGLPPATAAALEGLAPARIVVAGGDVAVPDAVAAAAGTAAEVGVVTPLD